MKLLTVIALLCCLTACGDDDESTATPGAGATPSSSPSATPTRQPTPFSLPTLGAQERETIQSEITEVAVWSAKGVDCTNPLILPAPNQPCVSLVASSVMARARNGSLQAIFGSGQGFERGIAVYRVDYTGDDRDYFGIMGAGPMSSWLTLETFTNAPFFQLQLPGEMIACPRTASARVFGSPSPNQSGNDVRGTVTQGQRLRVEAFRLVQQGPPATVNPGWGFYRVTAPVDGWIDSREAVGSFWGDCTEKYAFDGAHPIPAPNPSTR